MLLRLTAGNPEWQAADAQLCGAAVGVCEQRLASHGIRRMRGLQHAQADNSDEYRPQYVSSASFQMLQKQIQIALAALCSAMQRPIERVRS